MTSQILRDPFIRGAAVFQPKAFLLRHGILKAGLVPVDIVQFPAGIDAVHRIGGRRVAERLILKLTL